MENWAAIMYGTYDIRLEEREVPEPGPKEVLVEIRAVGVEVVGPTCALSGSP